MWEWILSSQACSVKQYQNIRGWNRLFIFAVGFDEIDFGQLSPTDMWQQAEAAELVVCSEPPIEKLQQGIYIEP